MNDIKGIKEIILDKINNMEIFGLNDCYNYKNDIYHFDAICTSDYAEVYYIPKNIFNFIVYKERSVQTAVTKIVELRSSLYMGVLNNFTLSIAKNVAFKIGKVHLINSLFNNNNNVGNNSQRNFNYNNGNNKVFNRSSIKSKPIKIYDNEKKENNLIQSQEISRNSYRLSYKNANSLEIKNKNKLLNNVSQSLSYTNFYLSNPNNYENKNNNNINPNNSYTFNNTNYNNTIYNNNNNSNYTSYYKTYSSNLNNSKTTNNFRTFKSNTFQEIKKNNFEEAVIKKMKSNKNKSINLNLPPINEKINKSSSNGFPSYKFFIMSKQSI